MYEIYNIQAGDTLSSIASKYGTTESMILQINGLPDNYKIVPGTQIVVPVEQNKTYRYYTVKKGDNMYQIAKKYNIDYDLLLKLNGLDKDEYIYEGQTILIPKSDVKLYITKTGDTIESVSDFFKAPGVDIIYSNNSIYLLPGQLIIYRKSWFFYLFMI